MRRSAALSAILAAVLVAAGCGGSSSSDNSSAAKSSGGTLTVDAAASLTNAFTALARTFSQQHPGWKVVNNFAGTDQLAAQVEQGQRADVFAGASPTYPEQLQQKNLLGPTRNFATNTLVIAVPAANPAGITTVDQLVSRKPKTVIGDPAVPIGAYTIEVLGNLGIQKSQLNIVSEEPDVTSILAKITTGAADAGFVYVTDALGAGSQVKQVMLPKKANATAIYPIGVLSSSSNKQAAQWWINLVTGPTGQAELKKLGFGAPPSSS
ncbi:MAG TPA: molybdate ABC transporter substrate-binding protein [Gaiellales bacterium]|nr:molybdate ABC transporter substrate-binding protein [Gaiellales bacterium]